MIELTIESFTNEETRHELTHWHNKIELVRITTGSAHCVINGENCYMDKGDICVINRQQLHMMYCDENSSDFQRLIIDPVLFASNKTLYNKYLLPVLTDSSFSHVKLGKRDGAEFSHLMDRIAEIDKVASIGYELEQIGLVYLLFRRLFILYQAEKGKTAAFSDAGLILFRKMADFIYENYQNKLELADIAAAGNVSKSKCGSIFKAYSGHTPVEFLNLYRLKVSADMLQFTDKTVVVIASSCGFSQQSYFNRVFIKEYGMSPIEYRVKNNQKKM